MLPVLITVILIINFTKQKSRLHLNCYSKGKLLFFFRSSDDVASSDSEPRSYGGGRLEGGAECEDAGRHQVGFDTFSSLTFIK